MAHVETEKGQNNMDVGAICVQDITTCQEGENFLPTKYWIRI